LNQIGEVVVVVRMTQLKLELNRDCDSITAREIYDNRAPGHNLPWVANVMGI
jgi:hypothetical protein